MRKVRLVEVRFTRVSLYSEFHLLRDVGLPQCQYFSVGVLMMAFGQDMFSKFKSVP